MSEKQREAILAMADASARQELVEIDAGEAANIDARGGRLLMILPETGATVTVSEVDSMAADAHGDNQDTTITARATVEVASHFYRVSAAAEACRAKVIS